MFAYLSSILCEKVSGNDEIEDTVDCSPAHELNEEFKRRFRDHASDPSHSQLILQVTDLITEGSLVEVWPSTR